MIGLFIGVESYNWDMQDFDNLILFCQKQGIKQVFLKVYEITQGQWYRQFATSDETGDGVIFTHLQDNGLDVIPYGFFYGNDPDTEIKAIKQNIAWYGKFCIDIESDFDGNNKIDPYVTQLTNHTGILYCSTWANIVTHSWIDNISKLSPIVDVWMPQAYDDVLLKEMYAQFPKVNGKIEPTFHITDTFFRSASIYPNCTLWEYQIAQNYTTELQNYIRQGNGDTVSTYPVNDKGMVANYLPISQFQPNHSEFECGAFAVSLNWRSTNYNVNNIYNPYNAIAYAEELYKDTAGSNNPSNNAGATIDNMHWMLKDTQNHPSGPPPLHFWDMPIDSNSKQADDVARIKAALSHGYPVIATVSEASVKENGVNPYWWGASGNHIITWVGIANDGNLLAVDPANVVKGDGNLQTPKTVQPWPRKYDIASIDNMYATIVQPAWLPPIPSGDPLTWQPYQLTPPSNPSPVSTVHTIQLTYDYNSKQIIFYDPVTSQVIYRISM